MIIHCLIILCILMIAYKHFVAKVQTICEDIQKMKDEHYSTTNSTDSNMLIFKEESDNKLQMLKVDMIELENKFYNLQNFYNKRINVVYKDIYNIKKNLNDDEMKSALFDLQA